MSKLTCSNMSVHWALREYPGNQITPQFVIPFLSVKNCLPLGSHIQIPLLTCSSTCLAYKFFLDGKHLLLTICRRFYLNSASLTVVCLGFPFPCKEILDVSCEAHFTHCFFQSSSPTTLCTYWKPIWQAETHGNGDMQRLGQVIMSEVQRTQGEVYQKQKRPQKKAHSSQ